MLFNNKTKTFVFHHVPKCAGTSMVSLFYQVFSIYKDYTSEYTDFSSYLRYPVETKYLNLSSILIGHWNGNSHYFKQRYPVLWKNPKTFNFCILRDPFEVRKSLFRYERQILESRNEKSPTFEEHLKLRSNLLSEWMGFVGKDPVYFLSGYSFIGFVETIGDQMTFLRKQMIDFCEQFPQEPMRERSLHHLKTHFPDQLPILNTSRKDEREEELNENRELFNKLNERDLALFHAAKCHK
jgi:hypothetical protein